MFPDSLFSLFNSTSQDQTVRINADQVAAFGALLAQQDAIRLFVGTGGSYGNQAATVNLLRRFTDPATALTFGYAGDIDVRYDGGDDTLQKLYDLLPELNRHTTGQVGDATVTLVPYDPVNPPTQRLLFGFTGAVDGGTTNLATRLNVDYFLQLQPYNYNYGERLWFRNDAHAAIDLRTVEAINNPSFQRRVSYVPPATYNNPDWTRYTDGRSQILQYLTSDAVLGEVRLVVSYALMPAAFNVINTNPEAAATLLTGGLLDWQAQGDYRLGAPVVILNLNRFGVPGDDTPFNQVASLLEGGLTAQEKIIIGGNSQPLKQAAQTVYLRRKEYMLSLDVASKNRFSFLNHPTTLLPVQNAVQAIQNHKDRVLFVQLGNVPQPLYYYALYRTNMFSLFEGANSTSAAINIGKPFLALPRYGSGASPALYPTVNRGYFSSSPPINDLATAANQINFDLGAWPTRVSSNPCRQLGQFLQTLTDQVSADDPIPRYFREVKEQYSTSDADKVNVALAYLMNLYQQDHPPVELARRATARLSAASDKNPLNALYLQLKEQVQIGQKLTLIPGVLAGGNIGQTLIKLVEQSSATFWMVVATFDHEGEPPDVARITLSGTSGVFSDFPLLPIEIVFDAPEDQLRARVRYQRPQKWSIPGVPWIQMDDPFIEITVSDGQIPVTAATGGHYAPIGADLSIIIPTVKNQWLASVAFSENYPSIAQAFQMAAGVNLVQILPPPLNTLVDLGLARVDLYYDFATQDVASLGFIIKNNSDQPLPLVGKVSLSDIEAQVAIVEPKGNSRTLASASGSFTIGSGPDAGVINVTVSYPAFVFKGGLASGVIKFGDLLTLFLPPDVQLQLPGLPTITAFDFNYSQPEDNLSVSLNLGLDWTFSFLGTDLFTLRDVAFAVNRSRALNTGSVLASTTLLPQSASPLEVGIGAYYLGQGAWRFVIEQQNDVFSINALIEEYLGKDWVPPISFPDVTKLKLELDWGKDGAGTAYRFEAKTATKWTPIKVLPDVRVDASLMLGYGIPPEVMADVSAEVSARVAPVVASNALMPAGDQPGLYGDLAATLDLWNIELLCSYNFKPGRQQVSLTWEGLTASVVEETGKDTIATFTLDRSLGELVETFVSWATGARYGLSAPWNVLDSISLSGISLVYNFTKKQVYLDVKIGPINFGLFTLKGVQLKYDPDNKANPVTIAVQGSFVWSSGDSLSWDPTKPETTPAPPGGGNKYLDLRLLALGQHVTVAGLTEEPTVQGVIAKLRDLKVPNPPEIPVGGANQPVFAPDNSWFVAMDFGVLKVEDKPPPQAAMVHAGPGALAPAEDPATYFIQLSAVFNDPRLYALRLALDGPMAKIFKGLDFQILYRQVSDTVGVYSARIALPDLMRKFQIGVATITLPDFAIDVYTNGDFQVDIGFPWKEDFSRSFTIEVIVAPGIPLLGSAGFYFGKLSSATTNKVPKRQDGWYNPVLVFGFGAQLGLGKSIDAGILKAGFSVTVFGIIEGVLARFLPYNEPTTDANPGSLQDGYYFSLTGTVGLQGRLYGSIDFAIISADVNVAIKLWVRLTFASGQDIPITAHAQVDVSVTVKINLGLFSISIDFSFSAKVEATFVLTNPIKSAVARVALGGERRRALGSHARSPGYAARALADKRMRRAHTLDRAYATLRASAGYNPQWGNLLPGATLQVGGYFAPVLTAAGDGASSAMEQAICYVPNFFLATPPPVQYEAVGAPGAAASPHARHEIARRALARARRLTASAPAAATFEDLAVRVLQWVIAAGQAQPMSPDQVDGLIVTDGFLAEALQYLTGTTTPTPIPAADAEKFLAAQAAICFALADADAHGVFFPAPPGTTLDVPDYGSWKGYKYSFGQYNTSSPDYLQFIQTYVNALKVQVDADPSARPRTLAAAGGDGPSIAEFVFGDYFTLIARQTVQALRDGLANFKLVLDPARSVPPDATVAQIVTWVNDTGGLSGEDAFTAGQLFVANQDHPLSTAATGPLTISGMSYQTPGGLSFTQIAAQARFGGAFTAKALALANASDARILAAGQEVTLGGVTLATQSGDSLDSFAARFDVTTEELLDGTDLLARPAILAALAILGIPDFSYVIQSGDQLKSVAAQFGLGPEVLADANLSVGGLFDVTSDPNLNVPELHQFQVGALIDEARRVLALQNLGGMASRYYLHGLRLPTQGLTAKARGLFVTGTGPDDYQYPPELGLFALTGQAFPLPVIPDPNPPKDPPPIFQFTLTRGASEPWLSLGTRGSASLTFKLDQAPDWQRYHAVTGAAKSPLPTDTKSIAPAPVAEAQPSRFPLSTEMPWQTPAAVVLPRQEVTPASPAPSLFGLPNSLINLPISHGVLPRLSPVLSRTDEATGATVDEAIANYGFGTLVTFGLRKVPPVAGSPTSERLYEIIGAPDREIVLLERLLDQLAGQEERFQQIGLMYRPISTGSEVTGWQMDASDRSLMGIAQVNLSTDTRPPSANAMEMFAAASAPPSNVIGPPSAFLRLLWEASITRQGGFYLSYATGIGGTVTGLPDRLFNEAGEAEVAVLALFTADPGEGQPLGNWMNVVATNEPLDTSNAAVVARAVMVEGTTEPLAADATLTSIATAYYTDPSAFGARNAAAALTMGVSVTASGGQYEVSPANTAPGGMLQAIADYFLTTIDALKQANPRRSNWQEPLKPYTALKLPAVTVEIGKTYPNGAKFTTLGDLASYFHAPLAACAAANAGVPGLLPAGAALPVTIGPISTTSAVQVGTTGLVLTRAAAPAIPNDPLSASWGVIYLQNLFSLLGYRLIETPDFKRSDWGLPGGPATAGVAPSNADKVRAPRAPSPDEPWIYDRTVPYSRFSQLGGGDNASPYLGVGGQLQTELVWLDLFGNRIISDLDVPSSLPLNFPPQIAGYTDRLLGVNQWPSVASAFVLAGGNGAPKLEARFAFDQSPYTTGDGHEQKIAQSIVIYQQILQQLTDPNGVDIQLATSVTPGQTSLLSQADKDGFVAWAASILAWLQSLTPNAPNATRARAAAFDPQKTLSAPLDPARLNQGQIFEITATLSLSRQAALVNGELSSVAGVSRAVTGLAPWTGSLTSNDSQRDLGGFAQAFTQALAAAGAPSYRVATGTDRNAFTSGSDRLVWAVQLGTEADSQAISYQILNDGNPKQYAPRPIANQLRSKPRTPIIAYRTGTVISPSDPSTDRSFASIDLDQWMRQMLRAVDELLAPRYIAPALILCDKTGSDELQAVLDAKKHLAGALKQAMIPVFAGETASDRELDAIRSVFYQRMLGTLSDFYAVKVGIQYQANVQASIAPEPGAIDAPRVFGNMGGGDARQGAQLGGISLTSPKLALRFADGIGGPDPHDLSFLLSGSGIEDSHIPLKLKYGGQYIEHQIGRLAGIQDYQPSSWLTFVEDTSSATWPLNRDLAPFDAPIVLREFPETPALPRQDSATDLQPCPCYQPDSASRAPSTPSAGTGCAKPGTYNPLDRIARWNYRFEYTMQRHFDQDTIHGQIAFNLRDPGVAMAAMAPVRDLFDNLAEFVQVYPEILADLDRYLVPIDVGTTDPEQLQNASAALQSAAVLIDWIAGTASAPPPAAQLALAGSAVPPLPFIVQEGSIEKTNPDHTPVEALLVMLTPASALPLNVGKPLVQVDPDRYECQPEDSPLGAFYFTYKSRKDGTWLPAVEGRQIAARSVVLPDLDILERQDALASVYLIRNEELVPGKPSADPFKYQTPEVTFPAPLHPTIDHDQPVDLATLCAVAPDQPVTRSLECQLSVLYDTLFASAGIDSVMLGLTAYYEYRVNNVLSAVRLPVYLMPPTQTAIAAGGTGKPLADVIDLQAGACRTWFETTMPSRDGGGFVFDLVILSDLTAQPMPLLRLRSLGVALVNLSPWPGPGGAAADV